MVIYPVMIQPNLIEIPEQIYSDKVTLLKYLRSAEILLAESYTLIVKIKQDNPQIDDELITNIADSWHYSIEALSQLASNQNEIILPNL
ncbi:hypothetical protein BV378_26560 [Nostoc sp. RF31YmG]|jgi:DNA-binding transcriptional regulator WhiA|nr:hypothetical protein BV378_26560 [Nostoc sp. RF31YmG]